MLTGHRFGVVGDPIAHSLSPALHLAGYQETGLTHRYDAVRVEAGTLADVVAGLDEQWRGLSVTAPLKREALALAADASAVARRAGAANTLVRTPQGWRADNTDIPGAVAALAARQITAVDSAVILGGGATATSLGLALIRLGVRRLRILVREPSRAAETVAVLSAAGETPDREAPDLHVDTLDAAIGPVDLVASTIPAAAQTEQLAARAASAPALFEALYDPWPTPLAAAVEATGGVVVGGLDLLVQQAALQFVQFTGVPAPVGAMMAAGRRALADRG